MRTALSTALALAAILSLGCASAVRPVADGPSEPDVEIVVEHWPDGQLRLRKQVLRQDDGTPIDHGTFERWYDNGVKEYEAVFLYGKKEGATVRYHRNGSKATEQEYREGRRHGLSTSWDASGTKIKEESWSDGRPHGTWTVWKRGKVKWTNTFEHGVPVEVASEKETP